MSFLHASNEFSFVSRPIIYNGLEIFQLNIGKTGENENFWLNNSELSVQKDQSDQLPHLLVFIRLFAKPF